MKKETLNIIYSIISIFGIILVAVLGSVFVNLGMDWFNTLNKPTQWIPNIIIPIVWSIIYITFGIILFFWIRKTNIPKNVVLWLIINGILNILWCLTFFTLQLTFVGNIIIILNLISGIILINLINKTQTTYSIFTSIYPVWLSIATSLNTALWILN